MEFFCIYLIDQRTSGVITVAPGTIYLGHAPTPTLREGETFHFAFCSSQLCWNTRNRTVCGKKERCQFCGSFGHIGEEDCAKQSDIVREFLRLQIGAEKIRPRVKKIGKFEDFSHIANSKTIVRDTLSTEEKLEQKDAEKKLKERLMAKFGIKGTKEEEKPSSPKPPEAQVAVFEEEVQEGDYYSPDEPDPSVFDGKDLRTAALAGVSLPFSCIRIQTILLQYKQITEQMHNCVIDCLRGEREDIVCNFNITMTKKDLYCLTGENWLNDKVGFYTIKQQMCSRNPQALEFYLQMVASRRCQESQFRGGRLPRVHCMSTYFFLNLIMRGYEGSIQRWNKDVDIFTFHMVLVPIHLQEHWCLAIIDFRNKVGLFKQIYIWVFECEESVCTFRNSFSMHGWNDFWQALLYYDPMGGENMPALSALLNYIGTFFVFFGLFPVEIIICMCLNSQSRNPKQNSNYKSATVNLKRLIFFTPSLNSFIFRTRAHV